MGGHNRWHPSVEPIARVKPGETLTLDAPLGTGDQIGFESTSDDLLTVDLSNDLLAGPVFVETAEPGDVLVVELVDMAPADFGFTAVFPGFGFLADLFPDPYLVTWRLDGALRTLRRATRLRGPGRPVSRDDRRRALRGIARRHSPARGRAGCPRGPRPLRLLAAAGPGTARSDGLGLLPPREIGGNLDLRQFVRGARLFLPVHVPGALLSLGDCHYAQGDGEVCGSAIEIGAQVTIRVDVVHQPSWRPRFPAVEAPARPAREAIVTTGIPVTDGNQNELLDIGLAARRALLEMIDFLETVHGVRREAAYALCSVAADLRIAQAVDLPNALVSLALPLDVFERYASPS